jgi:hypothetical protein
MITGPVPVPPQDTPKPRRSRQSVRALSSTPTKIDGWLPSDHAACRLSSVLPLTNCDTSTFKR